MLNNKLVITCKIIFDYVIITPILIVIHVILGIFALIINI